MEAVVITDFTREALIPSLNLNLVSDDSAPVPISVVCPMVVLSMVASLATEASLEDLDMDDFTVDSKLLTPPTLNTL